MLNYLEVVYKWSFGSSALAAAELGQVLGGLCWQLRSCSPQPLLSLCPCQHLHLVWDVTGTF